MRWGSIAISVNTGWQIDRLKNGRAIIAVPGCQNASMSNYLKKSRIQTG